MSGSAKRSAAPRTLVAGIGNAYRCDDAAGLDVARLLAKENLANTMVIEHSGDGMLLLSEWKTFQRVILIDALQVDDVPGKIHRLDASKSPLTVNTERASTHALSIADTIELARTLGELPETVIVYGIVGRNFEMGTGLTPAVKRAVKTVAGRVVKEIQGGVHAHA